ncbi:MAG: glycosyltransferase family 4 protein [Nitrosotalea sp.]
MKIGIIHPSFEVFGGGETTTLHLLNMLKETNHFTTLYTVIPPNLQESKNFKIHKVTRNNFLISRTYQKMKEDQQIFRDSNFEQVLVISSGGLTLENTPVKKVILYCNSTFEDKYQFVHKKFSGPLGICYKIVQNDIRKSLEIIRSSNVVLIANSNYTRETLLQLFQKDSRVIYPPVDIKKYSKFFDKPKKNLIITLSRFAPEKNLNFLIDVVKSSDLSYELIGVAKLKSQIKLYNYLSNSVKNSKNILLRSNISSEDIEQSLGYSKVYFHPSKETFGISVIEAISAGCIPIVPNDSAFVETVPFDVLRFKGKEDAIAKLKDAMDGKYDHLRPILRKHIEKFSIENFQNSMLKEIESIN